MIFRGLHILYTRENMALKDIDVDYLNFFVYHVMINKKITILVIKTKRKEGA